MTTTDELTAFRSLRSLEDLEEHEIQILEEQMGVKIRRPTSVDKEKWQEFKTSYRLCGKWKLENTKGQRQSQEPLEQIWSQ